MRLVTTPDRQTRRGAPDVMDLEGDTLTILTSLNNLSGESFGTITNVGLEANWVYDVVYGNGFINLTNFEFQVPEPSTLALLGLGMVGLTARRRRRRTNARP